ncbi:hypothetical protein ABZ816_23775 [Actinosynnema sp. NPDC047251]
MHMQVSAGIAARSMDSAGGAKKPAVAVIRIDPLSVAALGVRPPAARYPLLHALERSVIAPAIVVPNLRCAVTKSACDRFRPPEVPETAGPDEEVDVPAPALTPCRVHVRIRTSAAAGRA